MLKCNAFLLACVVLRYATVDCFDGLSKRLFADRWPFCATAFFKKVACVTTLAFYFCCSPFLVLSLGVSTNYNEKGQDDDKPNFPHEGEFIFWYWYPFPFPLPYFLLSIITALLITGLFKLY